MVFPPHAPVLALMRVQSPLCGKDARGNGCGRKRLQFPVSRRRLHAGPSRFAFRDKALGRQARQGFPSTTFGGRHHSGLPFYSPFVSWAFPLAGNRSGLARSMRSASSRFPSSRASRHSRRIASSCNRTLCPIILFSPFSETNPSRNFDTEPISENPTRSAYEQWAFLCPRIRGVNLRTISPNPYRTKRATFFLLV